MSGIHADPPPPLVCEPHEFQYATGPQLGKGGFAICHRAELLERNQPTGQIVALKIVRSKMEPAKLAQKFVTELQIHSKLHHPNIVEFYRAFSFEQSTYVVLELCENGSLADALKKRKFFTMPEIRRFIIQTCGAVKYLHERNIVHRDLKTGNLFLDKDMNVKVGDLGLAAVLISPNDMGLRRTTMCGTPNYLAPEILEKGGRGHNEKVDLWAIGIIAYTLAVGRAPFHAPKREDIYKKLQARDYKWPELSKIQNEISNDLRDLVGSLLVEEDDRPSPDQIVSHPFFKMAFIPLQLSKECTHRAPKWSSVAPPSARVIQRGYSDYWFQLCNDSGVGEYAPGKTFRTCGGKKMRSVVKDCEKELALGRQPVVPIPKGSVYLPFPDRNNGPFFKGTALDEVVEESQSSSEAAMLTEITANDRVKEQQPLPTSRKRLEHSPPPKENVEPCEDSGSDGARAEPAKRVRSVRKFSDKVPTAMSGPPTRASRSARVLPRVRSTKEAPQTLDGAYEEEKTVRQRPLSGTTVAGSTMSDRPRRVAQRPLSGTTLTGSTTEERQRVFPELDLRLKSETHQDTSTVPFTDPATVLARVSKFRDNIARAIANKPVASRHSAHSRQLPYVAKWVDYSKKHGIGYVLEDGSIGLSAAATEKYPVTHILVRDGFEHLKQVIRNPLYAEKIPFEYYVDCAVKGLRRTTVDSAQRKMTGILWVKFSRYMCTNLGQTDARDASEKKASTGSFVRFYQRLEAVGIWGFEDGSFQFNFPDHTKLVISADGAYCNFTCLPVEGAEHLAEFGDLLQKHIRGRDVLASTLRNLLHGSQQETIAFKPVTEANMLREKLQFIMSVANEWISAGGLGCLTKGSERMKWEGPQARDTNKKVDWVTIGRYGGDEIRA